MTRRPRRAVLATGALALVAGCVGDPEPESTNATADTPRENDSTDSGHDTGDESRPTRQYLGVEVPYVEPSVAHEWWASESATFADARSPYAYAQAHIAGAVSSPADDGQAENDPLDALDHDARIVTYCACPHHLSGRRAATLIDEGYTNVMGLGQGFQHWIQTYPEAVVYGGDEPVQQ